MAAAAADDDDDDEVYRNPARDTDEEEQEVVEQTGNEDDDVDRQRGAEVYNSRGRADSKSLQRAAAAAQSSNYHNIECMINNEYSVSCRQDGNGEVYLPFKFISKYFEVSAFHSSPTLDISPKSRPNNMGLMSVRPQKVFPIPMKFGM